MAARYLVQVIYHTYNGSRREYQALCEAKETADLKLALKVGELEADDYHIIYAGVRDLDPVPKEQQMQQIEHYRLTAKDQFGQRCQALLPTTEDLHKALESMDWDLKLIGIERVMLNKRVNTYTNSRFVMRCF
jgi:hypothetical protein